MSITLAYRMVRFALSLAIVCVAGACAATSKSPAPASSPLASRDDQLREAGRLRRTGELDEAIELYRSLLATPSERASVDGSLRHELSLALWRRGENRGSAADRAEAIEQAQHAVITLTAQASEDCAALRTMVGRSLGLFLRGEGRLDEAIALYQEMLDAQAPRAVGGESHVYLAHELGQVYLDRSQLAPGNGLDCTADLKAARHWQERALALAAVQDACPVRLRISIHNSLGLIASADLEPMEAVRHVEQAQQLSEQTKDPALQAEVLGNLVLMLIDAGRYDEARRRAEALEQIPGALTTLRPLAALGLVSYALGDYAEARQRFDLARFMADQDPSSQGDDSFIAQLAINAASAAQALGAYDEAERYLLDADKKLNKGGVDPRTAAVVKANLGRMYLTLERLDEAEAQLERVRVLLTEQTGASHPDTLLILLDLADLSRLRGHHAEARSRCETALSGLIAARGEDHPDVARARLDLASLCRDEGRCVEAIQQGRSAMAVLDAKLGPAHKQSVMACLQTTLIAADCQDTAEGKEAFAALRGDAATRYVQLRDTLGADNVEVLRATVYFADVNARTPSAYAQALKRYQEAEEGFLKRYGDGTLSMAALRLKQGKLLEKMGKPEESFRVYDRAGRLLDRTLTTHPIRAEILAAMGDLRNAQGDADGARPLWQEAYNILRTTYGSDHPRVQAFMKQRAE